MASMFPRPQQPQQPQQPHAPNLSRMYTMIGAMNGDINSLVQLALQRRPDMAGMLSTLNGMSEQQLEDFASSNPQFMDFYQKSRGKGLWQVMRENGIGI